MNMIAFSQMDNQPLIELQGVTKVYGTGQAAMHALRGIDLHIEEGDFVAVMGPSGSGKSTCMNILGCLDTPTAGTYKFKGIEVGKLTRNQRTRLRRFYLGFVFQGYNLLNRTSALENVELPLIYRGVPAGVRRVACRSGSGYGGSQRMGIPYTWRTLGRSATAGRHCTCDRDRARCIVCGRAHR